MFFQKLKINILKNPIYSAIVIVALLIFGITAYNSHGYYHGDEHYQIIEFAGIKLGTHTASDLAWEYTAQIRPGFQPAIAFLVIKFLNFIHLTDPYSQAFILRLLTGLFAVFVIHYFIQQTKKNLANSKRRLVYECLSYFLWFIPYLSVRFSSETLSGFFLLLGLSFYLKEKVKKNHLFYVGIIFGISYLFRFQIAFALIGFLAWMIIVDGKKWLDVLKLGIGFALVFLLGITIDSWFYDEFVFTSWNYFYENIVKDVASNFGTSPWYYYIVNLIYLPSKFLGIIILLSLMILLIFKPKSYLVWIIIPFILLHSIIPHKEERFLFSIIYLFPIVMMTAFEKLQNFKTNLLISKGFAMIILIGLLFVNSIGFVAMSQKSAGLGRMEISKYIHDHYGNQPVNLIYTVWSNPYNPWQGLPSKFYEEKHLEAKQIDNLCQINDSLFARGVKNLLVIRRYDRENTACQQILDSNKFELLTESLPKWIQSINKKYKEYPDQDIFELYIQSK